MIDFQKLEGPFGIPVYYQKMPDIIKSVSMAWVVFTGAADDESVGAPGLYHWFEHVPFRGTKKHPSNIDDMFTKYNGKINAYTCPLGTVYHAKTPLAIWKMTLSVITDLFAQPELREKDIEAERIIIGEEIKKCVSQSMRHAYYKLPGLLWPNHPYGHHTLGTEETLNSMDVSTLSRAHKMGYDRSRCALIFAGNVPKEEFLSELQSLSDILPNNGLSERRSPSPRGEMPWTCGEVIQETGFSSSIVMMLFPIQEPRTKANSFKNAIVESLFGFGGLSCPLKKTVREERHLAYSTFTELLLFPDGGYLSFIAETSAKKIGPVLQAYKDVLQSSFVCSSKRFEETKAGLLCFLEMIPFDPQALQNNATSQLLFSFGEVINEGEFRDHISKITFEDAKSWLDGLMTKEARTIVFKGNG